MMSTNQELLSQVVASWQAQCTFDKARKLDPKHLEEIVRSTWEGWATLNDLEGDGYSACLYKRAEKLDPENWPTLLSAAESVITWFFASKSKD